MTNDQCRLILTLPYEPGEAPHSFFSRLAMINGVNAAGFALDQGIRLVDVIDGEADALARLADLSGANLLGLQRAAFRRIDLRLVLQTQSLMAGSSISITVGRSARAAV